ncbi:hypothetical protein [Thermoleptolyngbya sp. C42_A2020_037]|uniref:hypothetical protein n=1 Tax=Thermoleptolyngbya sp. C42_A2020_037 TaxID=2747799 RepID=UPI00074D2EFB|nr:hypothetical protein [Thermoleptolyngbya sp. C42_A2020_037]MBF2083069.1 hypothetical protein [Thermoleptolyngbya sp. C42_A2020_037]BAU44857.1 hypothetical protein O77CONTIG1_04703 [Leptolyngbya sp. O-77]
MDCKDFRSSFFLLRSSLFPEDDPGQRVREGVVNYGVKIDPIVAFIRQFAR